MAVMLSNKKLNPIVPELFIRGIKQNITFVFITQSIPKIIRPNSTHYFVMKIPNKRELQQIKFNHSSDIPFKTLWIFIKSVLQNHILFWLLMMLKFWYNIDGKIRDEKLQYDIHREAAKILAWSSGKIDKYEYITGKEILPFDQSRIT